MSRTTSNRYYLWKYMGSSEQKCLQNLSTASSFDISFCYQLMQRLVRVVQKLKADVYKIVWRRHNFHEKMSEDWDLFDETVFSVRF